MFFSLNKLIQLCLAIAFAHGHALKERNDSNHSSDVCKPMNISIVLTHWNPPTVTVQWRCGYKQPNGEWIYLKNENLNNSSKSNNSQELKLFRITYSAYNTGFKYMQEVPAYINLTNIDNLQPNTKYILTVSAISINDLVEVTSNEVIFVSPSTDVNNDRFYNSFSSLRIRLDTDDKINIITGEVIVVVSVLCAWIGIIFLFIKKWGKIRTLEPNRAVHNTRKNTTDETISLNGNNCKSRLHSFANITSNIASNITSNIPKLQMDESQASIYSTDLSFKNTCNHLFSPNRPRLNSVFITSPSRRNSFMQIESNLPRRYKSAEDLQSLVMQITEQQRQQRKLSQFSINAGQDLDENKNSKIPQTHPNLCNHLCRSIQHNSQKMTCVSHKNSSIDIHIVESDSSPKNTLIKIPSSEQDIIHPRNCSYCRRRMSNCEECSHCKSINNYSNRNLMLMQSKSFVQHDHFSTNSSLEALTSSISQLNLQKNQPTNQK